MLTTASIWVYLCAISIALHTVPIICQCISGRRSVFLTFPPFNMFLPNFVVYLSRHFFVFASRIFYLSCFWYFLIFHFNLSNEFHFVFLNFSCIILLSNPLPQDLLTISFSLLIHPRMGMVQTRRSTLSQPDQTCTRSSNVSIFLLWTREIIATLITFVGRGYDLLFLLFSFYMFKCVTNFFTLLL